MRADDRRIWACVAISAGAHALALILFMGRHGGGASPPPPGGSGSAPAAAGSGGAGATPSDFRAPRQAMRVRVLPAPAPAMAGPDPSAPPADRGKAQEAAGALRPCAAGDASYEGVGISYQSFDGRIEMAPKGYPGYKAGLRVGDIVENAGVKPSGGYLELSIRRAGGRVAMRVKTEQICYSRRPASPGLAMAIPGSALSAEPDGMAPAHAPTR